MIKHRLNTLKHRLLVEKDRGNACRKNQGKKKGRFFWHIFLEVSVFTALTVCKFNFMDPPEWQRTGTVPQDFNDFILHQSAPSAHLIHRQQLSTHYSQSYSNLSICSVVSSYNAHSKHFVRKNGFQHISLKELRTHGKMCF